MLHFKLRYAYLSMKDSQFSFIAGLATVQLWYGVTVACWKTWVHVSYLVLKKSQENWEVTLLYPDMNGLLGYYRFLVEMFPKPYKGPLLRREVLITGQRPFSILSRHFNSLSNSFLNCCCLYLVYIPQRFRCLHSQCTSRSDHSNSNPPLFSYRRGYLTLVRYRNYSGIW